MKPTVIQKPALESNYQHGRTAKISQITFHHIVGDAPAALDRFQHSNDQVSANYVIGSDGTIYQCVADTDTAWCDGNAASNARTISIEHAGGIPSVPYSARMYKASSQLVAFLISKYGISSFKRHRDVIDTTVYPGGTQCPGELDVEQIVRDAQAINKAGDNMNVLTKEQINILTQAVWNRPATEQEKDVYDTKDPTWVFQTMLDSPANKEIRTKAANYDKVNNALQTAYAQLEALKKGSSK